MAVTGVRHEHQGPQLIMADLAMLTAECPMRCGAGSMLSRPMALFLRGDWQPVKFLLSCNGKCVGFPETDIYSGYEWYHRF